MIQRTWINNYKQTVYAGLIMFVAGRAGYRNADSMKWLVNKNMVDLEKLGNSALTVI